MSTVTITLTITVPDGAAVGVVTERENLVSDAGSDTGDALEGEVLELVCNRVPSRFRPYAREYLRVCVEELGCTAELPDGARRLEYVNLYPPASCRRTRVAAMTFSSTRTAIYTGAIDLGEFRLAEETLGNGEYLHPKLAHLDSDEAVAEAVSLTRRAIARTQR